MPEPTAGSQAATVAISVIRSNQPSQIRNLRMIGRLLQERAVLKSRIDLCMLVRGSLFMPSDGDQIIATVILDTRARESRNWYTDFVFGHCRAR